MGETERKNATAGARDGVGKEGAWDEVGDDVERDGSPPFMGRRRRRLEDDEAVDSKVLNFADNIHGGGTLDSPVQSLSFRAAGSGDNVNVSGLSQAILIRIPMRTVPTTPEETANMSAPKRVICLPNISHTLTIDCGNGTNIHYECIANETNNNNDDNDGGEATTNASTQSTANNGGGANNSDPSPFTLTCPMMVEQPSCRYWDDTTKAWSGDGCRYIGLEYVRSEVGVGGSYMAKCNCTHLTDFASKMETAFEELGKILSSPPKITAESFLANPGIFLWLGGLIIVCGATAAWGLSRDIKENHASMAKVNAETGTAQMLDPLKKITDMGDTVDQKSEATEKRIWTDPKGFRDRVLRRWWAALRLFHSLLQVYYFSSHDLIRPVRVLLLCVVLFTQMIVSAFLFNIKYGGSAKAPLSDTVLFAFVSAAVTLPVTKFFFGMFTYTGKGRYITLLYERLAAAEDEVATNRGISVIPRDWRSVIDQHSISRTRRNVNGEEKGTPQETPRRVEEKGIPQTLSQGAMKGTIGAISQGALLLNKLKGAKDANDGKEENEVKEGKEDGPVEKKKSMTGEEGKEGKPVLERKRSKKGWALIKKNVDLERDAHTHLATLGEHPETATLPEAMDSMYRAQARLRILKRQSQRKLHPAKREAVAEAVLRAEMRLARSEKHVTEAKVREKHRNSQVKKNTSLVADHKLTELEKERKEAGKPPLGWWARRAEHSRLSVEFSASVQESFDMDMIRRIPAKQRMARAVLLAEVKLKPQSSVTKWLYAFNPNVKQADALRVNIPAPVHALGVHFIVFLSLAYLAFANYYLIGFAMFNGAETTMAWMQTLLTGLFTTFFFSEPITILLFEALLPIVAFDLFNPPMRSALQDDTPKVKSRTGDPELIGFNGALQRPPSNNSWVPGSKFRFVSSGDIPYRFKKHPTPPLTPRTAAKEAAMSGDERGRRAAVRHLVNDIATEGIMQMLRAPPEMSNVTLFGEGAGIGGDADYGQGFEAAYERASAAPGLKAMGLTAMGGDFESAFEAASSMQQRESAIRRFAAHYTGTMIGATKNRMEEVDEVQLDEAWLMLEELASDQPLTAELKKAPKTAARADQTETTDKMMDETALNLVWELMHHEHAGIPAYMEAFDHTHDHSDARVLRLSDIADCLETAWKLHREDEATFAVKASIGPEGGLGLEINDSLTIVRVLPSARIMADAKVRARFLPLMYGDRIVAADRVGDASWLTIFRAGNSAVMPGGVPPGRSPAEAAPLVTDLLWFAPATSSQSTPDRLRQNFQSTSSFASGEQKRSIVGDSNSIDSWPIQSPQYHRSSDALPWVSPALPAAEGMRPRLRRSSFFSGEYNAVPQEADSLNKDQDEASKTQFSISHLEGKELEVAAVLRFHKQLSKWKRSSSRGRSRKKRRPKSETTPSGSAEGGASRIRRGHGRSRSGGLKDELRRKKRLLGDRKRLRRVFDLIDADGGGSISKKELLSAMRSNHVARDMLSESEALRPLMKPKGMAQLWAKLDVDHDGSISLPEWEAAASSVADHEKLRRVFQSIDIDDSNTISKKEILAVVRDGEKSRALFAMSDGLRPLLRPRGHTMLFKIMDRDGDGEISFEDFAAVCGTASDRLKLYRLFKSIDVDGSGSISRRELLKSIRDEEEVREYIRESENLRPLLKPRGFAVLFKTMDDDASGEISFKELVDFADGAVELIKLRQIFSILDADKGGSISRAEILSAVKTNEKARQMIRDSDTLRMFLKPREFARLYAAMDGDRDGEITFEEFTTGIAKAKAVHKTHGREQKVGGAAAGGAAAGSPEESMIMAIRRTRSTPPRPVVAAAEAAAMEATVAVEASRKQVSNSAFDCLLLELEVDRVDKETAAVAEERAAATAAAEGKSSELDEMSLKRKKSKRTIKKWLSDFEAENGHAASKADKAAVKHLYVRHRDLDVARKRLQEELVSGKAAKAELEAQLAKAKQKAEEAHSRLDFANAAGVLRVAARLKGKAEGGASRSRFTSRSPSGYPRGRVREEKGRPQTIRFDKEEVDESQLDQACLMLDEEAGAAKNRMEEVDESQLDQAYLMLDEGAGVAKNRMEEVVDESQLDQACLMLEEDAGVAKNQMKEVDESQLDQAYLMLEEEAGIAEEIEAEAVAAERTGSRRLTRKRSSRKKRRPKSGTTPSGSAEGGASRSRSTSRSRVREEKGRPQTVAPTHQTRRLLRAPQKEVDESQLDKTCIECLSNPSGYYCKACCLTLDEGAGVAKNRMEEEVDESQLDQACLMLEEDAGVAKNRMEEEVDESQLDRACLMLEEEALVASSWMEEEVDESQLDQAFLMLDEEAGVAKNWKEEEVDESHLDQARLMIDGEGGGIRHTKSWMDQAFGGIAAAKKAARLMQQFVTKQKSNRAAGDGDNVGDGGEGKQEGAKAQFDRAFIMLDEEAGVAKELEAAVAGWKRSSRLTRKRSSRKKRRPKSGTTPSGSAESGASRSRLKSRSSSRSRSEEKGHAQTALPTVKSLRSIVPTSEQLDREDSLLNLLEGKTKGHAQTALPTVKSLRNIVPTSEQLDREDSLLNLLDEEAAGVAKNWMEEVDESQLDQACLMLDEEAAGVAENWMEDVDESQLEKACLMLDEEAAGVAKHRMEDEVDESQLDQAFLMLEELAE